MSYKNVAFDLGRPNRASAGSATASPMAVVRLLPPPGSTRTLPAFWAAVDTGAAGLHLPNAAATQLGIPLQGRQVVRVRVSTASGQVVMVRRPVSVEVLGVTFQTDAYFYPNQPALLGRGALFAFLETVGFERAQWLARYLPQNRPQSAGTTSNASTGAWPAAAVQPPRG